MLAGATRTTSNWAEAGRDLYELIEATDGMGGGDEYARTSGVVAALITNGRNGKGTHTDGEDHQ